MLATIDGVFVTFVCVTPCCGCGICGCGLCGYEVSLNARATVPLTASLPMGVVTVGVFSAGMIWFDPNSSKD